MLLGFKALFAPFVEEGSKTHTIRAKRKIQPNVGEIAHCYTGLRQKGARLLGRFEVTKIERIEIRLVDCGIVHIIQIRVNGQELDRDEANLLAWRDGFRQKAPEQALDLMQYWWKKIHRLTLDEVFEGDLIHWKYTAGSANETQPGPQAPRRR